MKLSKETVKRIMDVVTTASSIGVEQLVMDEDSIRGHSEDSKTILLDKNVFTYEHFDAIGISRVKTLTSRFNMMMGISDDISIKVENREKDNGHRNASVLTIRTKGTSVEFRCADPSYIRAPKNLRSEVIYSFDINSKSLEVMSRGTSVMGAGKDISFSFENDKVQFNLSDNDGDTLKHTISEVVHTRDDSDTFFFKYNKSLLKLLKLALVDNDSTTIFITKRGILRLIVNNLTVYQAPEI